MFLIGLLMLSFLAIYVFCVPNNSYGAAFAFLNPYRTMLSQIYAQWQSTGYSICYGLCLCALLFNAGRLKRPFEWIVLRWIGLISFSLYMWHLPLLFLFMHIMSQQSLGMGQGVQFVALLAWVFFVIFPISLTLYRWIEMPGMRLGEMIIQKIEKSKKGKQAAISTPTPRQEATSTTVEAEIS